MCKTIKCATYLERSGFERCNIYLDNKTRHSYYIYVACTWPNGWNEWAEIFCGQSWVVGGCFWQKIYIFLKKNLFPKNKKMFPRATPSSSDSIYKVVISLQVCFFVRSKLRNPLTDLSQILIGELVRTKECS